MKVAIMQPYIFPYIGYFQLINASDRFIFYDDVTFIKQGWINRNYINSAQGKLLFTIPIQNISSNTLINETNISRKPNNWNQKILKTLYNNYNKAINFEMVYPLLENFFSNINFEDTISELAKKSIYTTLGYLNIEKEIIHSSKQYNNEHLKSQERVIDICIQEKADVYINAYGGMHLYSKEDFKERNVLLNFLQPDTIRFKFNTSHVNTNLSIIDLIMHVEKSDILKLLECYNLI
jgi:hypothetical protein